MHRRPKAGISLSIVLLGTILVPATAQAATVVRSYEIEKTSSDYTRGSVYFYNRLVEVIGQQEAEVQGIRMPLYEGNDQPGDVQVLPDCL